ncbi:MAG TPA: 50S ribosomal protein L25 [Myxococcota bacterium]|nr:50S ribosomal protein L25 [Myxococcota bacterium]
MGEYAIVAEERSGSGKGFNRKLRATGRIPAVVYGRGKATRAVTLDPIALSKLLKSSQLGINTLIDLKIGKTETVVLVREIQRQPVGGAYLHADFYEVDLQQAIQVRVPLHVVGKAKGVENGGLLDHPLRDVEIECLPRAIPDHVVVDVSDLDVGDSIHVRDLVLPEGATMLSDPDLAVASVVLPAAEEETKPAEAAAVEGEVAAAEGAAAAPAKDEKKD